MARELLFCFWKRKENLVSRMWLNPFRNPEVLDGLAGFIIRDGPEAREGGWVGEDMTVLCDWWPRKPWPLYTAPGPLDRRLPHQSGRMGMWLGAATQFREWVSSAGKGQQFYLCCSLKKPKLIISRLLPEKECLLSKHSSCRQKQHEGIMPIWFINFILANTFNCSYQSS